MNSHIQNSTNHFFSDNVIARSHIALTIHSTWPLWKWRFIVS